MPKTLTSANATAIMTLPIIPAPVILQGFSTDDLLSQDEVAITESRMGIDGFKSTGFINNLRTFKITFEATSPSINIMNLWINAIKTLKDDLPATAFSISVPSLKSTYIISNVSIQGIKEIVDIKKTTQPISYTFCAEGIVAVPIG